LTNPKWSYTVSWRSSIRHRRHAWFWDTVFVVICQRLLLRDDFRLSTLTLHSDLRRRAPSRLALPCTSSFSFFRHAFSEFPRPIALKLCHVVGIWPNFIMQVQKLGSTPPKKSGGQKHAKFRSILHHFRIWSRISPERLKISKIGRR